MAKFSILAAAAAFLFTACGDDQPGIAGGESPEVMSTVSALVNAPVGPGGEEIEVIVQVHHDPGLDPEVAADLLANIQVLKPEIGTTPTAELDEQRVWNGDMYWFEGEQYAVSIVVDVVDDALADEELLWEWRDIEVFFEHCPDGAHGAF